MSSTSRRIALAAATGVLALAAVSPVAADNHDAMVRVLHASPDAPAVDVYVDDAEVLSDVPFKTLSDYLPLAAGEYQIKVTPAGDPDTAVIDAPVTVEAGTKYTIAATNFLAEITPAILVDDAMPTSDGAKVRIVHFSPDAGAVDIAPDGADALVPGLEFPNNTGYVDLAAGAYDLEVRAAGTDTVALDLPEIALEAGTAYSVFAVGSAEAGTLDVVLGVDGTAMPNTDTVGSTSTTSTGWLAAAAMVAIGLLASVVGIRRFASVSAR